MKQLNYNLLDSDIFKRIISAAKIGIFYGQEASPYLDQCRWFIERYGCIIIFTRDEGYHSGGWWKNPDYERCFHLSISFPGGKNKSALNKIIDGLFGWHKKLTWIESPYSKEGKESEVWHYRLFCDSNWQPIKPRNEVYSTQFTDIGWKSFSELNYQRP